MADIELVIKIPEEQYNLILKSDVGATPVFVSKEGMMYAIKNGTPLPEHHGRLIDADALEVIEVYENEAFEAVLKEDIDEAPTIVPATKEGDAQMNEVSDPRYMQQSLDSNIEEVEIPIKHESKPYLMIPLPDGATNGDVIKAVFDVTEVRQLDCCAFIGTSDDANLRVYKDWWNAPYKGK